MKTIYHDAFAFLATRIILPFIGVLAVSIGVILLLPNTYVLALSSAIPPVFCIALIAGVYLVWSFVRVLRHPIAVTVDETSEPAQVHVKTFLGTRTYQTTVEHWKPKDTGWGTKHTILFSGKPGKIAGYFHKFPILEGKAAH